MKERIRKSASSIAIIFACAILAVATFLGAGRITAEASNKTFTLDFTNGLVLSYPGYKSIKESEISGYAMDRVMYDLAKINNIKSERVYTGDCSGYRYVFSHNQVVQCIQTSYDYGCELKAEDGCQGECSFNISKDLYLSNIKKIWDEEGNNYTEERLEEEASNLMKYTVYLMEDIETEDADDSTIYTYKFIFSKASAEEEKPTQQENAQQVKDETPAAPTYEVGKAVEADGLKYEILDKEGNLAFTGVTNKKIKKLVIPATAKVDKADLKVTTIKTGAIKKLGKLTSIKLGANITTLEKKSIYDNKNLKSLDIKSANLTSVAKGAVGKPGQGFTIKLKKGQKKSLKSVLKKGGLSKYVK